MKKVLVFTATLGLLSACGGSDNDTGSSGNDSIGSASSTSATSNGDGDGGDGDSGGDGDMTGDGDSGGDGDTGDGDTGETDSSGDGDACGGENCGCVEVTIPAIPPNVMLILDKSTSMFSNEVDDGMGGMVSRWESLYNVVTNVTAANDTTLNLGAQTFPRVDAPTGFDIGSCSVDTTPDVLVGTQNGAAILAAIPGPNATGQGGATPAFAGLDSAYNHLEELGMTEPDIPRYAIFITDGAANCDDGLVSTAEACMGDFGCTQTAYPNAWETFDENVQARVAQAFADGITTFVVGIGIVDFDPNSNISCTSDADCPEGTACCGNDLNDTNCPIQNTCGLLNGNPKNVNPADELAAIAMAGGAPNLPVTGFYDGSNQAQLQSALDEIGGLIPTCTLPLDPAPAGNQIPFVTIEVNGTYYGYCFDGVGEELDPCFPILDSAADCDTGDGFYWSVEFSEITLCGDACDSFKTNGELDASYGCPVGG